MAKFTHTLTGSSNWPIHPIGSSFNDGSTCQHRTVYKTDSGEFTANLFGMTVTLIPHYDPRYHGGNVPLWFKVNEWKERKNG